MKIVIEKEYIINVFTIGIYAIAGGDYKDIKEKVMELFEKIEYTTLPKGHGRLIDADALSFENTDFDTYTDYCTMFDEIDNAPTIIEADKEGEQE